MPKRMTKANAHEHPAGITYDLLHEIRRAMRILRRAEKWIVQKHNAEKRERKKSAEWKEAARIRAHYLELPKVNLGDSADIIEQLEEINRDYRDKP